MTKQDKAIAGITLAHGALGTLWTLWVASQIGYPRVFITANLILAVTGIAASIGWFLRRFWGACLAITFYLVQLVHVLAPNFQWSFTLGFNLNVGLGWLDAGQLALNLFALVMIIWASSRAFARNNSFSPNADARA